MTIRGGLAATSPVYEVLAYFEREDGGSAAEYALMLAIVGAALSMSLMFLGHSFSGAVNNAAGVVTNAAECIRHGNSGHCGADHGHF